MVSLNPVNLRNFCSGIDCSYLFALCSAARPYRNGCRGNGWTSLKMFSLRQWAAQERLVRELEPISTLLGAAGHEIILLKGPYLATRFFGGMNRREFYDLDILIRREDLPAVERLLVRSGYIQKSSTLLNRSLTTYFTHAFDFVKPNVAVDLHW